MYFLTLSLLFSCLFGALNFSKFKFKENLENLKNCLASAEDIEKVLSGFNELSESLSYNAKILDLNTLKEYMAFREEAIILLVDSALQNYETNEIIKFSYFVLKDVTMHESLVSVERIPYYIKLLHNNSARMPDQDNIRRVYTKLVEKLDDNGLRDMDIYLKTKTEKSPAQEQLEERIRFLAEQETSHQSEEVFSILMRTNSKSDKISTKGFLNLIEHLIVLDFQSHPDWFDPTFETLKNILINRPYDNDIHTAIMDLILSENVLKALPNDHLVQSFSIVLAIFLKTGSGSIFAAKIEEKGLEALRNLSCYVKLIKNIGTIYKCVGIINNLSYTSTEADLRMAVSAANNLKKLATNDPILKEIIKLEHVIISSAIKRFSRIFIDDTSSLFGLGWKTVCLLGFLCYELDIGDDRKSSSTVISCSLGLLLLHYEKTSPDYPTALINELLPNIDVIIESVFENIKRDSLSIALTHLHGMLKVIKLHQSKEAINSYTDRLCSYHISYNPNSLNKHKEIDIYEITDARNVYLCAFLTHLEVFLKDPKKIDLKHLKNFYSFLYVMKFITKIESLIISKIIPF